MTTKYYQLTERADENNSIGVIKCENGKFDLMQIKIALQAHFAEEITNIEVDDIDSWDGVITISFNMEGREDRETVDGQQTWLYL